MKKIFYWKNIELSVYTNLIVGTFFSIILWVLMWDKPMFIPMPIIWTTCLIIAYYVVIKTLISPPTSDNSDFTENLGDSPKELPYLLHH